MGNGLVMDDQLGNQEILMHTSSGSVVKNFRSIERVQGS